MEESVKANVHLSKGILTWSLIHPFFVILDNDWVLEEWKMFALQSEQHLTFQNARAYGPYRLFDF